MKTKHIVFEIAGLVLLMGALLPISTLAQGTGSVNLSYKIVDSISSGDTLTISARLRVKNASPTPMFDVRVRNTYTNNITINVGHIDIDKIDQRDTVIAPEKFIIITNIGANQGSLPKEAHWSVEYTVSGVNQINFT